MGHPRAELGGEIFSALGHADQELLSSFFRPKSFNNDEVIFLKGDPGDGLHIIRTGRVKICAVDRQGDELIFTFLSAGDLLGEMAILDGKPRSATAISVDRTDTFYLARSEFLQFLNTSPRACLGIIGMLCQRLRRLSAQMEEKSFLDVSGRIARNLIEVAEHATNGSLPRQTATCAISQEELATLVGASRVMVNKMLNSFVDLGLITIARRRLTIVNSVGLKKIAAYDGEF